MDVHVFREGKHICSLTCAPPVLRNHTAGTPCNAILLLFLLTSDSTLWNAFYITSFFLWGELLMEGGNWGTYKVRGIINGGCGVIARGSSCQSSAPVQLAMLNQQALDQGADTIKPCHGL
jgi:hypothetical protein